MFADGNLTNLQSFTVHSHACFQRRISGRFPRCGARCAAHAGASTWRRSHPSPLLLPASRTALSPAPALARLIPRTEASARRDRTAWTPHRRARAAQARVRHRPSAEILRSSAAGSHRSDATTSGDNTSLVAAAVLIL